MVEPLDKLESSITDAASRNFTQLDNYNSNDLTMKRFMYLLLPLIFVVKSVLCQSSIYTQPFPKPPKGVSEAYSTTFSTYIAPSVVHPGADFEVYAQNEPALNGQEIFWLVRVQFYNYQSIKFKKTIHLRCGNTIEKYAEIGNVKAGKVYSGSTFSGDADLSDLITSENCALKTNRIQSITISDVTGVMYPDDPANPEFQAKQLAIKNELIRKKQAAQQKTLDSLRTVKANAELAQKNRELLTQQQQQAAKTSPIINNTNLEAIKGTPIKKNLIQSSNSSIQAVQSTTQSIVDKFQQNQQSAQAFQTTLNSALNSYLQASQAKSDREIASYSSRSDAKYARLSTLIHLAQDNAKKADSLLYQSKEYEKAISYYLNTQLVQAYLSLNDCNSANQWSYKKQKEGDTEGTKNYFLFPSKDDFINDAGKLEEISIEKYVLPDLYKIPLCKVYTNEPIRKLEYEKAFAFLRKSQDCYSINIHDSGYRDIKYSKKIKDNFNEDSALYYLQKNIYALKVDNAVDLLDYANTLVWYNCLQAKHAQTTNDLYNGLKACIFFYKNVKQWTLFIRKEHFTIYDYKYVEVSLNIINYYFLSYYFQLAANSNDVTTKKWAANCMSLITNRDKNYYNQSSNRFSFPYSIYSDGLNPGAIEYFINYYSDASLLNIPASN